MVYVDNRTKAQAIATYLRSQLRKSPAGKDLGPEQLERAVSVFTAIVPVKKRKTMVPQFMDGTRRILICSEVAGMGLDFRNVERVCQFGIPGHLTISDVVQRVGRAARDPHSTGAGFIFVPENLIYGDR